MSKNFQEVLIGDILKERQEFLNDDDILNEDIPIISKISFRDGKIELRTDKTSKTQLILVKPGDLVVSGINAAKGAIAIYDDKNTVPVAATIHYASYIPQKDKVNIRYLWWLLRSYFFRDLLNINLPGGVKTELRAKYFLPIPIPLPPLEEQRRIVARIEELAAKIEEARGLQKQIQNDLYVLRRSIFFDSTKGKLIPTPMRDLLNLREADVFVNPEETYHFAGIYSFGKGMFKGQRRTGTEFSYARLTHLKTNNFVYPKLMAWEGALAIVPSECEGLVVSPEFPVFEVNQDKVLPETLEVYFQSPDIWPLLSGASTGTNVRRKRLNPSDFFAFEMPLPSMETQILLRDVNRRANITKRYHAETTIELNALLPSILDKAFKGEL